MHSALIRNVSFSQSGLQTDYCEIDHKLHPIIAGRRRNTIQTIQEETGTNIYFPSPFHGLNGIANNGAVPAADAVARDKNIVWITGEYFGVKRAKDMLFQLSLHKVGGIPRSCVSEDT